MLELFWSCLLSRSQLKHKSKKQHFEFYARPFNTKQMRSTLVGDGFRLETENCWKLLQKNVVFSNEKSFSVFGVFCWHNNNTAIAKIRKVNRLRGLESYHNDILSFVCFCEYHNNSSTEGWKTLDQNSICQLPYFIVFHASKVENSRSEWFWLDLLNCFFFSYLLHSIVMNKCN